MPVHYRLYSFQLRKSPEAPISEVAANCRLSIYLVGWKYNLGILIVFIIV